MRFYKSITMKHEGQPLYWYAYSIIMRSLENAHAAPNGDYSGVDIVEGPFTLLETRV